MRIDRDDRETERQVEFGHLQARIFDMAPSDEMGELEFIAVEYPDMADGRPGILCRLARKRDLLAAIVEFVFPLGEPPTNEEIEAGLAELRAMLDAGA